MDETEGVVYVVYGEKARAEAEMSYRALRRFGNLPACVIGENAAQMRHIPLAQRDAGGRWGKLNADLLSPFPYTLYLDADTRARGDIEQGFEILRDGWDMAITLSTQQEGEAMWHVDGDEREETCLEWGCTPAQFQGGVIFFQKNERVHALFAAWRDEWQRWGGADQAALLRALRRVPAKVWLLGRPYNGGSLMAHLFGKARA